MKTINEKASAASSQSFLWLFSSLVRRELADRYSGTALGLGWALIHPVLLLTIYAFVFSYVFRVRLPGAEGPLAYLAFVAVALWPWFLFQESLLRSAAALRSQSNLIRKTSLPRDLPVLVAIQATAVVHLAGFLLILAVLALAGASFRWDGILLFAVSMGALGLFAVAVGFLASLAQLIWRDLEQALQPVLGLVFYATPILYPLSLVPEEIQPILAMNPLSWWLGRLRAGLFEGALPGLADAAAVVLLLVFALSSRALYLRVVRQAEDLL